VFGRGSLTQAITVGGCDARGRDASNAITRCVLSAADLVRVGDPHVFLRWHERLDPEIRRLAGDLIASGLSMPLLIHDDPTIRGFVRAGVQPEDAARYCVIGCNELGIPGLSAESANARAGSVLYIEELNRVLYEHPDPDSIGSAEELLDLLRERLAIRLRNARKHYVQALERLSDYAPVPFTSALMHGCIEAGADMVRAAKYRLPGLYERQLTNAADAFAALDRFVFRERRVTLGQVVAAMKSNFEGAEGERIRRLLRSGPRWGTEAKEAAQWGLRLLEMREEVLDRIDAEFGHTGHMVCHVVRSLHHVDGKRTGASADGRCAGRPVCDSIGPQGGVSSGGPTAVLNAVSRIDTSKWYRGGVNLNLTLPADGVNRESVLALIEGFFAQGGQELQINCLDAEVLRAAQRDPERYGHLIVRFAGLSARFVDLSRVEQNELIARAEACRA